MTKIVEYFRIVDSDTLHERPIVQKLFLVKKTPKAAWLVDSWVMSSFLRECEAEEKLTPAQLREWGARIVYDGARRKYAYPTLELALESYTIRKRRQIQHASNSLEHAKENLGWALRAEVQPEKIVFMDAPESAPTVGKLF